MNITVIGASDTYARGVAAWAVTAGHQVTIVGPSYTRAEAFAATIGAGRAAGPGAPLNDIVTVFAMPYECVLDARDFYGRALDGRILVDVTVPIDRKTLERIHPPAGSVAEELATALPGARVLKAFSSLFAGALVAGRPTGAASSDRFLASDDREARDVVAQLFDRSSLPVIDVGPLRRARELEEYGYRLIARHQRQPLAPRD